MERSPERFHGGNGRHRYADVEAVRVGAESVASPRTLLMEVWERYKLPVAVTEVHLGCTHEEQVRWFHEVWATAQALRTSGVDIRAVTAWSLLGAYDWNSLVTQQNGHYEPGVYDLRAPQPRPTALARVIKGLAVDGAFDHAILDVPGWWHRPERLLYAPTELEPERPKTGGPAGYQARSQARELLILGHPGPVATAFSYICGVRGLPCRVVGRRELELTDKAALAALLAQVKPWAVINAAGAKGLDAVEVEPDLGRRDNLHAAVAVAEACAKAGLPVMMFSTAMVFDGQRRQPYTESHPTAPLNAFGRSKAEAERLVLAGSDRALVIRTNACFGPWDEVNFLTTHLRQLARGQELKVGGELAQSATYLPDLVHTALDLLIDGEHGIWHLVNAEPMSPLEMLQRAAKLHQLVPEKIQVGASWELGHQALRPAYAALSSERGLLMPPLPEALERYRRECRVVVT